MAVVMKSETNTYGPKKEILTLPQWAAVRTINPTTYHNGQKKEVLTLPYNTIG